MAPILAITGQRESIVDSISKHNRTSRRSRPSSCRLAGAMVHAMYHDGSDLTETERSTERRGFVDASSGPVPGPANVFRIRFARETLEVQAKARRPTVYAWQKNGLSFSLP